MHGLADFPKLDTAAQPRTNNNHPRSFIVEQIQKHNELAGKVDHYRSC